MIPNKILKLIILLFLINTIELYAQRNKIVYQSENRVSVSINKQNSPYGTSEARILQLLSKGNHSGNYSYSLNFNFRETKKIERIGRSLRFYANISPIALQGNHSYQGFDISQFIVPSQIAFNAEWRDQRGSRIIKSYDYKIPLNGRSTTLLDFSQTDTMFHTAYKLHINNYQLIFNSRSINKLENRINTIDKYYTDATRLEQITYDIQNIRVNDYNDINSNLQKINNLKRDLASLKKMNYEQELRLSSYDPANYLINRKQIENKLQAKTSKIEELKQQLPEIYVNKGKEEARRGNPRNAENYFNKALQERNNYTPAKLELAKIKFNSGNISQALSWCKEIESSYNVDYQTKNENNKLIQDIFTYFLNSIRKDIARGQYYNALKGIDEANGLCRDFSTLSCGYELDNLKKETVHNLFKEMEREARNTFSLGHLVQCEQKLVELDQFYSQYSSYLSHDAISLLWNRLYQDFVNRAKSALAQKKYDNALFNLNNAQRICNNTRWIECTTDIGNLKLNAYSGLYKQKLNLAQSYINSKKTTKAEYELNQAIAYRKTHNLNINADENSLSIIIQQNYYKENIDKANTLERKGKYQEALKALEKSLEIENNYNIQRQIGLQNSIERNAVNWANQEIKSANKLIATAKLYEAKKSLNKAENILNQYDIKKTNTIYNDLSLAKNSIYSVKCQGYEEEYNKIIAEAKVLVEETKFVKADKKFDQAIKYAELKSDCSIDFADAQTYKEEIKAPKFFVLEIKEIENLINYDIHEDAIIKYVDLSEFYKNNDLNKFHIQYLGIYNYAKKQNYRFILYTIKYALDKNELQKAYNLLKELKNRNIRKSYTKTSQTLLAAEFAKEDFEKNRHNDPKQKVLTYTYGDNWYQYFKKAYIKQWKNLK